MTKIKTKQIDWSDFNGVLSDVTKFKETERQIKLYELSLSAVEEENKKLKKEIQEIKKFIYKKQ